MGLQLIQKAPSVSSPSSKRFLARMPLSLCVRPGWLLEAGLQLLEEKRQGQKWEKPVNILTMIFISFLPFFPPSHCHSFYRFLCSFLQKCGLPNCSCHLLRRGKAVSDAIGIPDKLHLVPCSYFMAAPTERPCLPGPSSQGDKCQYSGENLSLKQLPANWVSLQDKLLCSFGIWGIFRCL